MDIREEFKNRLSLRLDEASEALGISKRTLWQLAKDGKIPCVRVGGNGGRAMLLFPVEAIRRWLEERATKSVCNGGRQQ